MLLRHSCCERYCSGYICNCTNSLSVTFPFAQLQFLQHQMQQQQMGMAVGAAAQAALPRQHSANQPRSKRKRSTPQPLPKSWPPAPPTNPSWGRQQTALCLIGSILRTDCGSTGLKLIFFFYIHRGAGIAHLTSGQTNRCITARTFRAEDLRVLPYFLKKYKIWNQTILLVGFSTACRLYFPSKWPFQREPVWLERVDPTHTNKGRTDVPKSPVAHLYRYEKTFSLLLDVRVMGRLVPACNYMCGFYTAHFKMAFCYTERGVDVYSYGEKKI